MKKILYGLLVTSVALMSEVNQKGIFIGLDYTPATITLSYDKDGGGIATNDYTQKIKEQYPGFKLGYQYYYTRLYFHYNTINYKDE